MLIPTRHSRSFVPKFALVALALAAGCAAPVEPHAESAEQAERAAEPATPAAFEPGTHVAPHNMVIFGSSSEKLYLSHVPLYGGRHNIQILVEVTISTGVAPEEQAFANHSFFMRPTAFSLSDLALGTLRTITGGTIFFGDFTSGGKPAFRDVQFDVVRVLFARMLAPTDPKDSKLEYIAVGTPSQPFLVHVIDGPPSFDQIISMKLGPNATGLDAASLAAGTRVQIEGRENTAETRVPEDTEWTLTAVPRGGSPAVAAPISVHEELSCLVVDELEGCPPSTR